MQTKGFLKLNLRWGYFLATGGSGPHHQFPFTELESRVRLGHFHG
jgi:hypothetical protein